MSRIDAAVKAVQNETYGASYSRELARITLAASDAFDAANGVHRLVIDDATVERAARALTGGCSCIACKAEARAVLAAAVKEDGE